MNSPRLDGPSEKLGTVISVESPELESLERHSGDVAKIIRLTDLASTALLSDEIRLGFRHNHPSFKTRATFIDVNGLSTGRDYGQHGSRFGQLIINGAGLHERPTLAALKPFEQNSPEDPDLQLANEWMMNDFLNRIGNDQQAFIPLGVWRNAEGISHLLTVYENDVISYDNTFWADRSINPEALRPETLKQAYKDCLLGLGYLHGVGIAHGDAEAKNLAAGRSGVRFIDLEDSKFLPEDEAKAILQTRNDIETFLDSTVQVDENRPLVKDVLSSEDFRKSLGKTYRAGIRAAEKDLGHRVRRLPTSRDEYFKRTINHTLTVAGNSAPSESEL